MTSGGWRYAAASVIGTSHQSSLTPVCQDFHACQYIEASAALVSVVSDGAGSASHSQFGSRHTCNYVIQRASEAPPDALFTREFAVDVLERLRTDLEARASEAQLRIREFACTMLVAIIRRDSAVFWQVGDGAMCFRVRDTDTFHYAFWPEKGDYANVTFFVTDPNAEQHLEFDLSECEITELAAFSDGLERLALNFASGEPHAPFLSSLFPYLHSLKPGYSAEISAQITTFLNSDRVNKRTDDDKTLILAARLP